MATIFGTPVSANIQFPGSQVAHKDTRLQLRPPWMVEVPEMQEQFQADKVGNLTAQTDGRNNRTSLEHDELNRLIKLTDPAPHNTTQQYSYDKVGNKQTETDRRNNTTTYSYDNLNRLTGITDPAPISTSQSYSYDSVGNRLTETDRRSTTTNHSYDTLNRLTQSEKPDGQGNTTLLVRNEYDANNNITAITDANNNRTENSYSPRNLLQTITYADATQATRSYDEIGNLQTETDEAAQITRYSYDNENRLTRITNPANETESYRYDKNGNRTTLSKPKNNGWNYSYDALNRLASVSDSLTNRTRYEYDTDNNQTAHIDATNNRVQYQYDALNRRTAHIQHKIGGNLTVTYGYDNNGNLTTVTDAMGRQSSYSYDQLNRQTNRSYPNLNGPYLDIQSIAHQYDANSNLTQITETKLGDLTPTTDITQNSYDLLDRLTSSTQRGNAINYQYDANGNRTQISSAGGVTAYSYNNRNRLITATANRNATTYSYYTDGKKQDISYPNGTKLTHQYDAADRISQILTKKTVDNTTIAQLDYQYDSNGNRKQQLALQNGILETTDYSYDTADRLTTFTVTQANGNSKITAYTLDEASNRMTETVTDHNNVISTDKSYSYDDTHWLTTVNDNLKSKLISYSYDANGNTVQKLDETGAEPESTVFAYDVRNQLTQTRRGPPASENTVLGEYDYNYQGMRIRHQGSERGDITYYYDGKSVLEERNASNTLVAHYRYADRLLSLTTPTDTQYYHQDALGSTTHLSDEAGTTQVSYRLDPWGHITEQQGTSVNRQVFTGQEHDENTNLIYFGARYYDLDSARFLNQDSYLGETNTPPSLHRYLYAYGNPLVYIDPNGHIALIAEARDKLSEIGNDMREFAGDLDDNSAWQRGAAAVIGIGSGALDVAAAAVSGVNYAANVGSVALGGMGANNDDWAMEHALEMQQTHQTAEAIADTLSSEEGRDALYSSAKNTLSSAASGDTRAIADVASIFTPAGVVGGAAKAAKVGEKLAKAGQATARATKAVANTVKSGLKKAKDKIAQQISREPTRSLGDYAVAGGQRGAVGPRVAKRGLSNTDSIRFTQDTIGSKFSDGRSVQSLIDGLKSGKVSSNDLPPIRTFQKDGLTYTLDNRRLFATHQAGVKVKTAPATAKEIAKELPRKFTTRNQGTIIGIRGRLE